MSHKPIQLKNIELSFPQKICFQDFSTEILEGSRIAIIGRNGTGKSSLLKILYGESMATEGEIIRPSDASFAYVPQVIEDFNDLSGGQRLNKALTQALSLQPNVLLLDEPTNHLDKANRKSLMRMLQHYTGTLVVVSHDTELLRNCVETLWHIDNSQINIFSGSYDDYMAERRLKRASIEAEISRFDRQKKDMHDKLMREQQRAAKSKSKGEKSIEQRKWPTVVSKAKALRAEQTTGRKKSAIDQKKQGLAEQLSNLRLPEVIIPTFSIDAKALSNRIVLQITDGSIAYTPEHRILSEINVSLAGGETIAFVGDNGSGKTSLAKAILGDPKIIRTGTWFVPKRADIGYLDQHYSNLDPNKTVLEFLASIVPDWDQAKLRRHLNDFLFRSNEEVNNLISNISGGEKARLTLAEIAAKTPSLLILDEITNNLDLETKAHVINVLKAYPGSRVLISHDQDFLDEFDAGQFVSKN